MHFENAKQRIIAINYKWDASIYPKNIEVSPSASRCQIMFSGCSPTCNWIRKKFFFFLDKRKNVGNIIFKCMGDFKVSRICVQIITAMVQ